MTPHGVKYIDPNDDVAGIPLVDLACFAGLVRDVEHLPASELGYELLKQLATRVGEHLAIPEEQAVRIFYLGRVLQCFLSSRFRIVSDIALARHFFDLAKSYLERILSR